MIWRTVRASVVGTSHVERGVDCQDYSAFSTLDIGDNRAMVVAVADGAGSASHSQYGAELVCTSFVAEVENKLRNGAGLADLDETFGKDWLHYIQQRIVDIATSKETSQREYASTFLGAILDDESAVFYQVGDGGILYSPIERDGEFFWGLVPKESEYANTTDFVTDKDAHDKIQCQFLSLPVSKLMIFTDGMQNLAIDYSQGTPGIPFVPFLKPMFAPFESSASVDLTEKLRTFLGSETVNERTDDDKTLVLIVRESTTSIELTHVHELPGQ
jgi:hypothetical protein